MIHFVVQHSWVTVESHAMAINAGVLSPCQSGWRRVGYAAILIG
jgi:hypothetical protein